MQLLYCKVFINDVCILSLVVNSLFLNKLLLWYVDSEYHFSRYTIKKTLLLNFCLNFFFLFIQYLPSTFQYLTLLNQCCYYIYPAFYLLHERANYVHND